MSVSFNPLWNPHYDFLAAENRAEIEAVENYKIESDVAQYMPGQVVDSPWGSNQVVDVMHGAGAEICLKKIMVKPGYMLSLQRHRGRAEIWDVTDGILTAIVDGRRHEIPAGQSITLPMGAVHCMINSSDRPVFIRETQRGICREKDNIRLVDFNNRPTYPLTSDVEYKSARLYAQIQAEHAVRYGFDNLPPAALLGDE